MLLAGTAGVIAVCLFVWSMRTDQPLESRGFALISRGVTANLVDRIHQGAVTDFLISVSEFCIGSL